MSHSSPLLQHRRRALVESLDEVRFEGTVANNVESFLNIRFGQDTSGFNRFAPPKPFNYAPGTLVNATQAGAACLQPQQEVSSMPLFHNFNTMSKDCLNLRNDQPAKTLSSAKLPVMVWIYGGGDSLGQIYDSAYDPTRLVNGAAQKGFPIIYVTANYRVRPLGLLPLAQLPPATPRISTSPDLAASRTKSPLSARARAQPEWSSDHGIQRSGKASTLAYEEADDGSFFTLPILASDTDVALFLAATRIKQVLALYPVSDFAGLPAKNISTQYFEVLPREPNEARHRILLSRSLHRPSPPPQPTCSLSTKRYCDPGTRTPIPPTSGSRTSATSPTSSTRRRAVRDTPRTRRQPIAFCPRR
ncbi:alpha/beta-hydrolase [Aspergillus uvarum CBS 121591]|uniref:Alpha/beta-hydrolase n=1 Tax=Aspergillus uvarum CBS 121591 TaxID=1448315 RepID=A0A319CDT8_9EURO|nr:alpha/beta-hydrolase [Aspergillus uvarum CBS 121591]PYH83364.1 alpha/beta-hydrolase [Aspergillus uvarum CBS 121591]